MNSALMIDAFLGAAGRLSRAFYFTCVLHFRRTFPMRERHRTMMALDRHYCPARDAEFRFTTRAFWHGCGGCISA